MIHFVTTKLHGYTVTNLIDRQGAELCKHWNYENLFAQTDLPQGTWIFTDHERLFPTTLQGAAFIAKQLQLRGDRVLNNPALVRSRYEVLRRLQEAGINRFSVYRADSNPQPRRFPVFIRNEHNHLSDGIFLIQDQEELDEELELMESKGIPLIGKLVIEYCGEEFLPETWRRFSSYCIGGKIISHHTGFDDQWIVKDGFDAEKLENHPDREELLSMERNFVMQNQYDEILREVFSIARIDYGRADFSIYDGQIQVFEINTNPMHGREEEVLAQSHPGRRDTLIRSEDILQLAIKGLHGNSLDTPGQSTGN
ncbi:hypothetical protein BOW37_11450 [Solemya velum gill symbiont]|uniref:hypothetical protein n=1 Tax=Solemya velum gill symbiont TaxID=2340 RepID=UPI000997CDC1|nr:hypothetical protein [Solemya velum gill symbiont]OOZ43340.1 hypothetical protein BOW37_11450 [Solemya velum gill symbiont]OOZ44412.1 hypothetical protein BOW38_11545 [Solemya velum gill symbiont]OOZ48176.1 hypothetical protein BOW39_12070 [Solemya velum gill symbiont]OOZ49682.1 hypothetical protein BOW40_11485 [Solemya velum gill symbiont]OOZ53124.1 hypothetical protein BOW41_11635 [Solemya velum gill symbiont]